MLSLGLFIAVLAGTGSSSPGPPASPVDAGSPLTRSRSTLVHPQDGPHLDFELRVEPDLVRLSVQLNLACADELVGALREDTYRLDPVEIEPLREALAGYFEDHSELHANGKRLFGTLSHFDWTPPDLERMPYYPRFGARALTTIRLGFEFPSAEAAETLRFAWDIYPPNLTVSEERALAPPLEVRTRVIAYGTHEAFVLRDDAPELVWNAPPESERLRMLEVPGSLHAETPSLGTRPGLWLSLALGIAGLVIAGTRTERRKQGLGLSLAGFLLALGIGMDPRLAQNGDLTAPAAQKIFLALHTNLYRSFDSTREEEIYAALTTAVNGDLLDTLYTEMLTSLSMQEEGGARAEVEALRHGPMETVKASLTPASFDLVAQWEVDAAVHHFGHFHRRTTGYKALYTVGLGEDGWKIQGAETLEQVRLATSTDDPGRSLSDAPRPEEIQNTPDSSEDSR